METLAEARAYVQAGIRADGVVCPACDKFAKMYGRILNASLAKELIDVWHEYGTGAFHSPSRRERWMPVLRHWGLVEETEKRAWWRLTEEGAAFVNRKHQVPKCILLYGPNFLGFKGPNDWAIEDALGSKFDYRELMGPVDA